MSSIAAKGYRGMGMEGFIATWYSGLVRKSLDEYKALARAAAAALPAGAAALDLAPGPGYFAVELARLGRYRVCGLDISRSFVRIGREQARQAGVEVEFRLGNAAAMPYEPESFDFLLCRAAFKNFAQPVEALREMRRVLKPGGSALIIDLRRDVSPADIRRAVEGMGLSPLNAWLTRQVFRHSLIKRAYTRAEFERMFAQAGFGAGDIEVKESLTGLEMRLRRSTYGKQAACIDRQASAI
jgi:ubiquinone/menaquinone biosynthesis C-methylase UbiE